MTKEESIDLLESIQNYMDNKADVVDDDSLAPFPNTEMSYSSEIEKLIEYIKKSKPGVLNGHVDNPVFYVEKETLDKINTTCLMVMSTLESDIKELEGLPFTGKNIGTFLGYQSAAIKAVANCLVLLINK